MLAALPLILQLAPEIARWIGGSQGAGVTTLVTNAVQTITGTNDPDAAAKFLQDNPAKTAELRVQLAKIAADADSAQREADLESLKATLAASTAKQQTDLEALRASIGDLGSARAQEADLVKANSPLSWAPAILSLFILVAFAVNLYVVLVVGVKADSQTLGNVLLGTLTAMATQVANYWLGSSLGSKAKDSVIQNAQAAQLVTGAQVRSLLSGSPPATA
jgi:hypothetical protein